MDRCEIINPQRKILQDVDYLHLVCTIYLMHSFFYGNISILNECLNILYDFDNKSIFLNTL